MSSDVVYTAIHDYLVANFTAAPLCFENEPLAKPTGTLGPWVRVEMRGGVFGQRSFGAGSPATNVWREEGTLWCHVYVQTGDGPATARTLATQIQALFMNLNVLAPNIRFEDASIGAGMTDPEDGNYWPITVTIAYVRN